MGALVQPHAPLQAAGRGAAAPAAAQSGLRPVQRERERNSETRKPRDAIHRIRFHSQVHKSFTKGHTLCSRLDLFYSK